MAQNYARPLRLPMAPPNVPAGMNLAKLKKSREQLEILKTRFEQYTSLLDTLQHIKGTSDDEINWKVLLYPYECIGFRSALEIVKEPGILIHVGDNYYIVYSKEQAFDFASDRHEGIKEIIKKLEQAIVSLENLAKDDFGLPQDWNINERDEVLNEEGLPFIEIYEEISDDTSSLNDDSQDVKKDKTPESSSVQRLTLKEKSEFSKGFADAIAYKPAKKHILKATSDNDQVPHIIVSASSDSADQILDPIKSINDEPIKEKKTVKFDLPESSSATTAEHPQKHSSSVTPKTIKDKVVERPSKPLSTNKSKEHPKQDKEKLIDSQGSKTIRNTPAQQKISNSEEDSGVLELSSGYATYSVKDLIRSSMHQDWDYSDNEDSADDDDFDDYDAALGMDELDEIFHHRSIAMDYVRQRQAISSVPGHGPLSGEGFFSADNNEESEFIPIDDSEETSIYKKDRFKNAQMIIPTLPTVTQNIMKGGGTLMDLEQSHGGSQINEDDDDDELTHEERERVRKILDKIAKGEIFDGNVNGENAGSNSSTDLMKSNVHPQPEPKPPTVISVVSEKMTATKLDDTSRQSSVIENKHLNSRVENKPRKVSRFKAERGQ